jgi:hypothetical protein
MKFAYADPPYLGCGSLYAKHHPEAKVWDNPETHRALIQRLVEGYPDGWAMSLHAPSLKTLLPMAPSDVRIGAWVKPYSSGRPGVRIIYAWEPVIFRGGRKGRTSDLIEKDWIAVAPLRHTQIDEGIIGMKPRKFCRWLFCLMGATAGDTFDDLFPGTGAITAAWSEWIGERTAQIGMFAQTEGKGTEA